MNQFVALFETKIKDYYDSGAEDLHNALMTDIPNYANVNPQTFLQEVAEVRFNLDFMPLPVVLEALSSAIDNWGQFYIDTLQAIFEAAKKAAQPSDILANLMEYAYIENADSPFIQTIVDRTVSEINTDNLTNKLAAITLLSFFLKNPAVRNKSTLTNLMQQLLHDKNWKVRYVTYESLCYEDMLPAGEKLSVGDKILKLVWGDPTLY